MKNQNVYAVNVTIYTDEYQHDHKIIATYATKKDAHDHAKRINNVVTDIKRRYRENKEYKYKQLKASSQITKSYYADEYYDKESDKSYFTIKDEYKDSYKSLKIGDYVISVDYQELTGVYQMVECKEQSWSNYAGQRILLRKVVDESESWCRKEQVFAWHDYPEIVGVKTYDQTLVKNLVLITDEQVINVAKGAFDYPHKYDAVSNEYFAGITFDNAYLDRRQDDVRKAEVLKLRIQ